MNRLSPKKVNTLYIIILMASALIAFIGDFFEKTALCVIGVLAIQALMTDLKYNSFIWQ